jgi:hypothetical protein
MKPSVTILILLLLGLCLAGCTRPNDTDGSGTLALNLVFPQTTPPDSSAKGALRSDDASDTTYFDRVSCTVYQNGTTVWGPNDLAHVGGNFEASIELAAGGGYSVQANAFINDSLSYYGSSSTFEVIQGHTNIISITMNAVPGLLWFESFGGGSGDYGHSVQQTSDGGYIIAGTTESYGTSSADVYLIKTDASGNLIWQRTFGGSSNEEGSGVQQTSDGGYIIAGSTESYGAGSADVYLIKIDASGNLIWQRTFGGSSDDFGLFVQQTSDGGNVISGATNSYGAGNEDVYLIKTDASGNLIWQHTFGGSSDDGGYGVQQTSDDGYIIAGYTFSYAGDPGDVYLIKTDVSGNLIWQRTFGGSFSDYGSGVQQTSDGGYIITGYTYSYVGDPADVYLIKTDASGNLIWQRTFGGSSYDYGFGGQQTSDGGYIIAGYTSSFGAGFADVYLIKTDTSGNLIWQCTFGGSGSDLGYSVQQTADGGYIITGKYNDDVVLLKYSP